MFVNFLKAVAEPGNTYYQGSRSSNLNGLWTLLYRSFFHKS